jgi:uncharacterized membrane protein YeiH
MDINDIIFIMEIIGTIAFAASGALVGIERRMDIFGVCVLGVVTAVGGGMTRDVILGITPPNVFRHPSYAVVATITSCIAFLIIYIKREHIQKQILEGSFGVLYDRIMLVMDSIGLGIFTVVGVNTGIQQGYIENTFLLVFVGTITGVGGGLLRDMMAGVPPYIFVKHIYACASIVGAIVCVYMHRFFGTVPSMLVSCVVILVIRYLAAHYRWNLPRIKF